MSSEALPRVVMPPNGKVVSGPSALGGGIHRFLALTRTIAVQEFKLRFFGSILGYLWQLMRPLMLFGVLYFVFTKVVRLGSDVPFYPVLLLTGIVMFTFFAEATSGAVTAVVDRENLVRKIHFPRLVIPMAVVLTAMFNLTLNFVVVLIFALLSGVRPGWSWLAVPPILVGLAIVASGVAMLLSAAYVRYRDVRPIWEVFLQMLFYAAPVLYPIEKVAAGHPVLAHAEMCSPFAAALQEVRHLFLDSTAPSAGQAIGGNVRLVIPILFGILIFALGFWYFNREAPRIAEDL